LLEFEKSVLGNQEPQAVARQQAERNIDQIRRDVYDSHRHRAYSLAYYMTGNEVTAEGLLARCFTRAFAGKVEPDGGDVDLALLAELREDGLLAEIAPRGLPPVQLDGTAGGNLLRTDLEEALRELPAAERLIFLLGDVEGYSAGRIAALTGRTEAEIAQGLMGARLRLRAAVAEMRKKREDAA
jgi:RNA polymerase sigma-70 factor (ECF subfamily)